jgi:UDP-GlcNAc:undecaprenyl-phosphate GlcNAc-1-phosphate transferase
VKQLVVCLGAFSITVALLWILRPLAIRIGLVDHPGERKRHVGSIALVGGVAMFCGLMFSIVMADVALGGFRAFFTAASLLVIVGILDDFHELPSWARFAAQIVAALLMTLWGGAVVTDLGALTGGPSIELGIWSVPFTVFATIGVINAINMIDGADGLAGGVALLALVLLAWAAASGGRDVDAAVLLLLSCAVVAFLLFNARFPGRRHALVFMGDAGSMLLGFSLAWFAVTLSQGGERAMTPVCALWILALPLIDTVAIIIRRIASRRLLFVAARDHFHHLLLDAGYSVNRTVAVMLGVAAVAGAAGVIGLHAGLPESLMFAGFLSVGLLHLWNVGRLARVCDKRAMYLGKKARASE